MINAAGVGWSDSMDPLQHAASTLPSSHTQSNKKKKKLQPQHPPLMLILFPPHFFPNERIKPVARQAVRQLP